MGEMRWDRANDQMAPKKYAQFPKHVICAEDMLICIMCIIHLMFKKNTLYLSMQCSKKQNRFRLQMYAWFRIFNLVIKIIAIHWIRMEFLKSFSTVDIRRPCKINFIQKCGVFVCPYVVCVHSTNKHVCIEGARVCMFVCMSCIC